MNKRKKLTIILVSLIVVIASLWLFNLKLKEKIENISYTSFIEDVEEGKIDEVVLSNLSKISVIYKNGNKVETDNPDKEDFKEYLLLKEIKVIEENKIDGNFIYIGIFLLSILITVVIFYKKDFKETEKEMENLSKIDSQEENNNFRFSDVAGNQEAKEALKEMVDFIKNPDKYEGYGAKLPRGVLLYGPPGTGKTLLAKALAGEAGVPIYPVSGSDFIQIYAGLGASRIRNLFKTAKEAGKSVIFIDEIDALGKKRKGNNISGSDESDRTLNALLTEMSGFKGNEGIIVLAATNRIDVLDEALLRPGRFDRQLEIELPDVKAREEILKLHTRNKPLSRDVNLRKLALDTIYFSGAKLENLLNESAMLAAKKSEKEITKEHIDRAYYKVLVGDEKKDRSGISARDRMITAYHEAGHALVTKLVSKENRVTKVSIIPSTKGIGGFSLNIPPDRIYSTKEEIINNIKIALGGRAAEELKFGKDKITTGASSDLEKATELVFSMICIYGMDSSFGLLNYNNTQETSIYENKELIKRAKDILDSLYSETLTIIRSKNKELEDLANELLKKETLDENEINRIIFNQMPV